MNADTITPQQAYDILATVTLTPNEADQIAALIRRQADDLAAIEKAGKAAFGEMRVFPYFEDGWDVEISQPDGQCWLHGRGDTLADACRAATKGAG